MMRIGLRELLELDQAQLLERDLLALGLADAFHLEPEGDVAKRGAPGKELRKVLEHNAAVGALAADGLTADADLAAGRRQKSRDDVKERGLAAARGTQQAEELRLLHLEADAVDAGHAPRRCVVDERDVADFDVRHRCRLAGERLAQNIEGPVAAVERPKDATLDFPAVARA